MTDAERLLWSRIRRRQLAGVKFRRQAPIGQYIADFAAFEPIKLIVELDGGQHVERKDYDQRRTEYLSTQGFRVLRFWNHEVLEDIDTVLDVLWRELTSRQIEQESTVSHPQPSEEQHKFPPQ